MDKNMKKDYQTKDIKATKTKTKTVEEGVIFEDTEDGIFKFVWNGETHGFTKEKNAKIALNRFKGV
jgi:hypothetical protein